MQVGLMIELELFWLPCGGNENVNRKTAINVSNAGWTDDRARTVLAAVWGE